CTGSATRSTLIPYTTLFRSPPPRPVGSRLERPGPFGRRIRSPMRPPERMRRFAAQINDWIQESRDNLLSLVLAESSPVDLRLVGDRKSTRLNSSHVKSSYAA